MNRDMIFIKRVYQNNWFSHMNTAYEVALWIHWCEPDCIFKIFSVPSVDGDVLRTFACLLYLLTISYQKSSFINAMVLLTIAWSFKIRSLLIFLPSFKKHHDQWITTKDRLLEDNLFKNVLYPTDHWIWPQWYDTDSKEKLYIDALFTYG